MLGALETMTDVNNTKFPSFSCSWFSF